MKLTVYIVDDEPMAIMNLELLLGLLEFEVEVVGNAPNGVKAVADILRLKPDFVFADITMPVMDGLEMSREILKENPEQIILLLTAYQDFEYAKQGIKIGVKDYIVKNNLSKELLENVLRDNIPELEKQRMEQHLLLEKNIRNWLRSNDSFGLANHIVREKSLQRYVLLYVAKKPVISIRHCEKEHTQYMNCLVLQEKLYSDGIYVRTFVEVSRDEYVGICLLKENTGQFEDNCRILANEVLRIFNENEEKYVCIISKVTSQFWELQNEYIAIKQCMSNTNIISGKSLFMYSEFFDEEKNIGLEKIIENELSEIKSGFYSNNRDHTVRYMTELMDNLKLEKSIWKCMDYVQSIFQFVQTVWKEQMLGNEGFRLKDCYGSLEMLKDDFIQVVDEYFSMISKREQNKLSPKVIMALDFISKNYKDNISVIDIAEAAGISEGHLRRCFRMELNKNVVSYLMEYRLNCAKKLLKDGHFSIEEVCRQTGFSSPQYFSSAFKKSEGVSPKEYARNLNGVMNHDGNPAK